MSFLILRIPNISGVLKRTAPLVKAMAKWAVEMDYRETTNYIDTLIRSLEEKEKE